jgi:hypothetical protein
MGKSKIHHGGTEITEQKFLLGSQEAMKQMVGFLTLHEIQDCYFLDSWFPN